MALTTNPATLRVGCCALLTAALIWALPARCAAAGPGDDGPAHWIILPESIRPFSGPTTSSLRRDPTLLYGQVLRGSLVPPHAKKGELPLAWVKVDAEGAGDPLYLPLPYVVRRVRLPRDVKVLPIGKEPVDRLRPLPLDYRPNDLTPLDAAWSYHADASHRLRSEAARAAVRMLRAARTDRVHLRVASSYRSAKAQRHVYLRKIEEAGWRQKTVAKPGHSEHQLGTTLDISGLDPATSLRASFADTPEGRWLRENAPKFGFRISYTPADARKKGYVPEPWHIRYWGAPGR